METEQNAVETPQETPAIEPESPAEASEGVITGDKASETADEPQGDFEPSTEDVA